MQLKRTRTFEKQYRKLSLKIRAKFDERLVLWLENPEDSRLRVHSLQGKYRGYWSFNVTGDVRALYRMEGTEVVIFALIGTHSELYG
jgi:addiction module RelE/StbE family toxin